MSVYLRLTTTSGAPLFLAGRADPAMTERALLEVAHAVRSTAALVPPGFGDVYAQIEAIGGSGRGFNITITARQKDPER